MEFLDRSQLRETINRLSASNTPFLFLIDFKGTEGLAMELSRLAEHGISCSINGVEMGRIDEPFERRNIDIKIDPIPFEHYKKWFDKAMHFINHGDSYLLNLTYATKLTGDIDLNEIYQQASAQYKFMLQDRFVFYSPEPFVRIEDGIISSFPMKGTIDHSSNNAYEQLIGSQKELQEHYTIVDLIRNDLSMVSSKVKVDRFRYVECLHTQRGDILQTSSQISGILPFDWSRKLGDILLTLLPAGSVSGAPKERSLQIIEECEPSVRGFYTGVMGICVNGKVDSCVNIRYLEQLADRKTYYRSGGGITASSQSKQEYQELLTKIYVPII